MKISWYVLLLFAAYAFTAWVCVIQDRTIQQQTELIRSFETDAGCMHTPPPLPRK